MFNSFSGFLPHTKMKYKNTEIRKKIKKLCKKIIATTCPKIGAYTPQATNNLTNEIMFIFTTSRQEAVEEVIEEVGNKIIDAGIGITGDNPIRLQREKLIEIITTRKEAYKEVLSEVGKEIIGEDDEIIMDDEC